MKKWMIPALLLIALLVAACSPAAPAPAAGVSTVDAPMTDDAMTDERMADESMGDEAMADESMSDDAMTDESMSDDETMSDEAMSDDGMTDHETMDDETMDDETMVDEAMSDDAMMDDEAMSDTTTMALPAWQTLPLVDANSGESFTLADFAGQTVFVEPMATWCTNCRRQLQNVAAARGELAGESVRFVALSLETNLAAGDLANYTRDEGFDWTFAVMSPEMLQSLADAFGRSITSAPSTPHFIIRPDGSTTELTTGIDSPAELVEMIRAAGG